eukprot:TRINITY_DN7296_c0_g3_i3.p1 TRINITY_DN7296_c0_g3~~TRINITY_DN7296_c0_g3_i3.p1  ORF type:complete len:237 (+),score=69.61 TRINITY_DN7296_c0_g3_i3:174-884(+)
MGKKEFKFSVAFTIHEMTEVPLSSGVFYAKWKLKKGGKAEGATSHIEITNKRVSWELHEKLIMECDKMKESMMLDMMLIRISIRQEKNGGKSHTRLGIININASEFANLGNVTRKFLMQESRLNSPVKISIVVTKIEGGEFDPPKPANRLTSDSFDESSLPSRASVRLTEGRPDNGQSTPGLSLTTGSSKPQATIQCASPMARMTFMTAEDVVDNIFADADENDENAESPLHEDDD